MLISKITPLSNTAIPTHPECVVNNKIPNPMTHLDHSGIQGGSPTFSATVGLSVDEKKVKLKTFFLKTFFFNFKDSLATYLNSNSNFIYDNEELIVNNQNNFDFCCFWRTSSTSTISESEGVTEFATCMALGLSYMYQDIIPLLDKDSNEILKDYFVYLFRSYLSEPHPPRGIRTVSVYSILMNSLNRSLPDRSHNCNIRKLFTTDGFSLSFNHILSLGVLTPDESKYEPRNPINVALFKEFPHYYRHGTSDVLRLNQLLPHSNNINLQPAEGTAKPPFDLDREKNESIRQRFTSLEFLPNVLQKNGFEEFWTRTKDFANLHLSQREFQFYSQLIPIGKNPTYLLKEIDITDTSNGSGSGG